MLAAQFDPIVAIATASGRGAVGIVRVSGRGLAPFALALLGRALTPRHASYLPFPDARGVPLDHGLALYFPAPQSYTGEDVLELHAHGGPVVLQLLVARCLELAAEPDPTASGAPRLAGLRLAHPGEFTQRAFLNDKLDLAQAEAVGDLIEASTEAAARSAGRSLDGAFSRRIDALRDGLVSLRTLVEAALDFPDEEIDVLEQAGARGRLLATVAELDAVLGEARQGALLREGITVVLAGQPNVGKSSLLNALAGAELAIVTPVPGTTRDKVAGTIQLRGVPLHVVDTAGLRDAGDEVERIGVARSWEAIAAADAVLWLRDLTRLGEPDYDLGDADIAARLPAGLEEAGRLLQVFNKSDAGRSPPAHRDLAGAVSDVTVPDVAVPAVTVSALTGDGIELLRERLLAVAGWQPQAEGVFTARARHLQALRATRSHLDQAFTHIAAGDTALELLAEELRLAHDALGEITGAFGADALLGEIFGRFCIGK